MSDIEEPPTKVVKYEMSQTFTQPEESLEEGQEEWLSEGLLTDDDLNPDNVAADPDRTRSDLDSQGQQEDTLDDSVPGEEPQQAEQEEVSEEVPPEKEETAQEGAGEEVAVEAKNDAVQIQEQENRDFLAQEATDKAEDKKIEQTLTSMSQPADELAEFLKSGGGEPGGAAEPESDANDTDDLLRMLEDDDKTKRVKLVKTRPKQSQGKAGQSSDEDDDDYIFDGATVRKLKVAKNALLTREAPARAVPEDSSDDDTSEEDAATLRKMFTAAQSQPKRTVKQVVRIGNTNSISFNQNTAKRPATSTPVPQPRGGQSLLKNKPQNRHVVKLVDRPGAAGVRIIERKSHPEHEEIINEEEFLEEDIFDLREDFAHESDSELDKRAVKQRIMRPERMEEDMLSDPESHSDDGSLYEELPSSESDTEEWFTLDIRAERAGDYLPLLGARAYDLLLQEKARVSVRVRALREHLSALSATARRQADRLRAATAALADVDDVLRAA